MESRRSVTIQHKPAAALRCEGASRQAVLLVNTRARQGEEWFAQTQECLREYGIDLAYRYALTDPSELPKLVEKHVAQGAKWIIVGGGDGSFRSVAGHIAHTDVALGILPLGTVNDLARNLGIEANVEAACKVIAEGYTARIDLCQANDDYFLITASLGFSAQTQHVLTPTLKKAFGPCGYLIASLLAMRRLRNLKVTVEGESQENLMVVQAGVVKGHSWMGGKFEIPGVNLENGRMAFYATPPQSGMSYLHLVRDLMCQRFFHTSGLRAFLTVDVTIRTETPQPLVLDGDLCGETPVRLRVLPNALTVCVPREFERVQTAGG